MRLLRLWTRDYENDKDIQALANIAKVCCKIPFNARTKASITESGIPKNIKKLSKTDSKDDALRCMRLWGEGNKNIMAGAAVVAESSPAVQPAPLALFEAARDFISEKRNKYITNR